MSQIGLKTGGTYKPKDCGARYKIAIIVPFRDREEYLRLFLGFMHPFLQRQQLDYTLFLVEQTGQFDFSLLDGWNKQLLYSLNKSADGSPFNRGMLMNIGFKEALLQYEYFQCFIFHDVDLLPENDGNSYSCPEDGKPRHMTFKVDIFDYE